MLRHVQNIADEESESKSRVKRKERDHQRNGYKKSLGELKLQRKILTTLESIL